MIEIPHTHETGLALNAYAENMRLLGEIMIRPSSLYRPDLTRDGNMWCALYGQNLMDGVAGFGESPELAYADFDKQWRTKLKAPGEG